MESMRNPLKYRCIFRLKIKGWRKIHNAKSNKVLTLILDKVDFIKGNIIKDKEDITL